MTPEQRFDKIDERLDAIARNLELLSAMHLKTEQSLQELSDTINRGMDQTARILQNHELRIDNLEDRS